MLNNDRKGFTLIELIIVISIIGILAAIAIPRMSQFGDSAKAARIKADHRILVGSIQMWQADDGNGFDQAPDLEELDAYFEGTLSEDAHVIEGGEGDSVATLTSTLPTSQGDPIVYTIFGEEAAPVED